MIIVIVKNEHDINVMLRLRLRSTLIHHTTVYRSIRVIVYNMHRSNGELMIRVIVYNMHGNI